MSFLAELRRRNVFKVAAAYAIVGWLLVQVADTLFPRLQLPDWTATFVAALVIIGFPIALILSWAFELTPEGIKQTRDVPIASSFRHITGQQLNYLVTALLVLAMGFLLFDRYLSEDASTTARPGGVLTNSIAVLPFVNLSPNPDDAYFAAGIHEEILNQLAKIPGINVIARTSVLRYANDPPPVPEIAKALKVETVLEGSVRYSDNAVRVSAQLIDGATGSHLWSNAYDGDLSDVFRFQTDIATEIAHALRARIMPDAQARLETRPTDSPAAYALFLEGRDLINRSQFVEGRRLLERAIAIDPRFAMAYALSAYQLAWTIADTSDAGPMDPAVLRQNENRVIDYADKAIELDESIGLAWSARATLNRQTWHWANAEENYRHARLLSPNDALIMQDYAYFLASTGKCDTAMPLARRQNALDPNSVTSYFILTLVGHMCHRYDEALDAAKRANEMTPASAGFTNGLALSYVPERNAAMAVPLLRKAEQLITDQSRLLYPGMIYAYGLLGLEDEARRLYEMYRPWAEIHPPGPGDEMLTSLGLGDAEAAYKALQVAVTRVENGVPDPSTFGFDILRRNAHKDPVLDQQRFRDLFDEIDEIAWSR